MIVDLLSPANYIMVNRDAVKILGLNTAVYTSELLTIYKKVVTKKKFVNDDKFFEVDRAYIEKQTSLELSEQLKCDINLSKVNIVKINEENPNIIYFDIETYASVLASEDIKVLDDVSSKVKVEKTRGTKKSEKKYMIESLKNSIECRTPDILFRLYAWIDSIFESGKGLGKAQVKLFKDRLDDYCQDGSIDKAVAIINIAIANSYTDCQWAINSYERQLKMDSSANVHASINSSARYGFTKPSEQKITTAVSKESF